MLQLNFPIFHTASFNNRILHRSSTHSKDTYGNIPDDNAVSVSVEEIFAFRIASKYNRPTTFCPWRGGVDAAYKTVPLDFNKTQCK